MKKHHVIALVFILVVVLLVVLIGLKLRSDSHTDSISPSGSNSGTEDIATNSTDGQPTEVKPTESEPTEPEPTEPEPTEPEPTEPKPTEPKPTEPKPTEPEPTEPEPTEPEPTEPEPTEPPHQHSYSQNVVAPTCTTTGYTIYSCDVCGYSYNANYVSAKGHYWRNATCTSPKTCIECNQTEGAAIGHSWNDATCATPKACGTCGATEGSALGHNYKSVVTAPTCTANGYTTHTCQRCGNSYKDSYTDMIAHKYTSKVTTASTCAKEGECTYTCSTCGHSYVEKIAKTEHNCVKTSSKSATCTEAGYDEYTCSACGYTYKDNIPATGHKRTKTETTDTHTIVTCLDCGIEVSRTPIPSGYMCLCGGACAKMNLVQAVAADMALGNYDFVKYASWTDWNVQACTVCGLIYEKTIEFAYTDEEACEIMLGYVNELRREVLGEKYVLESDQTLLELAKIRADEIVVNFSHYGGTWTHAAENITGYGPNIYDQFKGWKSSDKGHYEIMTKRNVKYFGYALRRGPTGLFYGVQLFWSTDEKLFYEYNKDYH